jgi:hypothetical protein
MVLRQSTKFAAISAIIIVCFATYAAVKYGIHPTGDSTDHAAVVAAVNPVLEPEIVGTTARLDHSAASGSEQPNTTITQTLKGRVIGVDARPVPSATVRLCQLGAGEEGLTARTNGDGTFVFQSATQAWSLEVHAHLYALTRVTSANPTTDADGQLVVRLRKEGELRGTIRSRNGSPPSSPLAVHARLPGRPAPRWDSRSVDHPWNGDSAFRWTEPDGSFRFVGVPAGVPIVVCAVGEGVIGRDAQGRVEVVIEADAPPLEMFLDRVVKLDVIAMGANGEPPITSPRLSTSRDFQWTDPPECLAIDGDNLLTDALWSQLVDNQRSRRSSHELTRFYVVSGIPQNPVDVDVRIAGYLPANTPVPLTELTAPPHRVTIFPASEAFGMLVVRLASNGHILDRPIEGAFGFVRIRRANTGGPTEDWLIPWYGERELALNGIPHGRYTVRLNAGALSLHTRSATADVTSDVPGDATIEIGEFGSIRLDVFTNANGVRVPFMGRLLMTLMDRSTRSRSYSLGAEPPFVIPCVAPGPYDLLVFGTASESAPISIEITAGNATRVAAEVNEFHDLGLSIR